MDPARFLHENTPPGETIIAIDPTDEVGVLRRVRENDEAMRDWWVERDLAAEKWDAGSWAVGPR